MKKMKNFIVMVLWVFLQQQSWVFLINGRAISPVFSPLASPLSSPISSSMAEFSPGVQVGTEDTKMDTHKRLRVALIVACASVGGVMLFFISFCIYHWKNSYKPKNKLAKNSDDLSLSSLKVHRKSNGAISNMDYKLLEGATGNFDENNVLGVGGFGCVYKAKLNGNNYVAVKKINCVGQEAEKEFENEIELLSKIRHQNIISLLGYCIHNETRFLVYELMENGCLETQLHGVSRGSALTWHIRLKIALDVARGLEYLHEHCNPPVIHRDLKSSNILLDSKFNAKLSDFGLAITDGPHIKNNIKLSGTLGYVAPEYLLDGKLTDKSDVYAFGVVLLELILGRKPVEKLSPSQCQSIVTWAMPQLTDRSKLPNIVDPLIRETMDPKHLYQIAAVAVLCVQPEPSYRPLITDVLHSLVPLVPVELGGTLRVNQHANSKASAANLEQQTA